MNNACLDLNYVSSNEALVGTVPISEWNSDSQAYVDVMQKTSGLSFSNEALAAEYDTVIFNTQNVASLGSSTTMIVVLRMPTGLDLGEVVIDVKSCAGSESISSNFIIKDPDPNVEVGAYPFSEGGIAFSSVNGGGLLAVTLTNFPVVYQLTEIRARFGETHADLTRLIVSDCDRTLVYVRVPPGDAGQIVVHMSFSDVTGKFDFMYVDDNIPYVQSYAPSSVYVDEE